MSTFNNIEEFNKYVSERLTKYTIEEYFKAIHSEFNKDVDISFMDYFLSLIKNKKEFCVEQEKLIEYGIIKTKQSNHVKDCIEKYNFIKDVDYKVFAPERSGAKQECRGGSNAKNYKMKPHVFKMCLMRSKNTNTYAKYYLELEECFYYYNEYQFMYKEVLMSGKDNKIDNLTKTVNEQSKKIDDLLKYAKSTESKLDEANENIENLNDTVENLNEKVEEVRDEFRENLEHVSRPLDNKNLLEMFMLVQNKTNPNQLKIIKGQKQHLSKKCIESVENNNVLIDMTYNPNTVKLFNLIKIKVKEMDNTVIKNIEEKYKSGSIKYSERTKLKREYQNNKPIKISSTNITLNFKLCSLNEFIDLVNECDNERRETYVP